MSIHELGYDDRLKNVEISEPKQVEAIALIVTEVATVVFAAAAIICLLVLPALPILAVAFGSVCIAAIVAHEVSRLLLDRKNEQMKQTLKAQIKTLTEEKDNFEAQKANAEKNSLEKFNQMKQTFEGQIKVLEAEKRSLTDLLSRAQKDLQAAQMTNTQLNEKIKSLETAIGELKLKLNQAEIDYKAQKVEAERSSQEKFDQMKQALTREIDEQKLGVAALVEERKTTLPELEEKREENQQLRYRLLEAEKPFKEKFEEQATKIKELTASLRKCEEENRLISAKLKEAEEAPYKDQPTEMNQLPKATDLTQQIDTFKPAVVLQPQLESILQGPALPEKASISQEELDQRRKAAIARILASATEPKEEIKEEKKDFEPDENPIVEDKLEEIPVEGVLLDIAAPPPPNNVETPEEKGEDVIGVRSEQVETHTVEEKEDKSVARNVGSILDDYSKKRLYANLNDDLRDALIEYLTVNPTDIEQLESSTALPELKQEVYIALLIRGVRSESIDLLAKISEDWTTNFTRYYTLQMREKMSEITDQLKWVSQLDESEIGKIKKVYAVLVELKLKFKKADVNMILVKPFSELNTSILEAFWKVYAEVHSQFFTSRSNYKVLEELASLVGSMKSAFSNLFVGAKEQVKCTKLEIAFFDKLSTVEKVSQAHKKFAELIIQTSQLPAKFGLKIDDVQLWLKSILVNINPDEIHPDDLLLYPYLKFLKQQINTTFDQLEIKFKKMEIQFKNPNSITKRCFGEDLDRVKALLEKIEG